jgi:NhaP-type Na+/H+ or K+/H+ antiporter
MTEYPIFIAMALLILGYGFFSKLSEKSLITAPMIFVGVGVLVSFFDFEFQAEGPKAPFVKVLAELTLILVLFIDASTINLKRLVLDRKLPTRLTWYWLAPHHGVRVPMLAIPFFPEEQKWVLILMAFILSPTDAALGQAVVTGQQVPQRIRQTINVESGLNDGIALPPILVCLAVLGDTDGVGLDTHYWLLFVLKQFVFGPVAGALVGWGGGYLVDYFSKRGWMSHTYQMLASLAIAILAFSFAEIFHGNGFIAAYIAGLLLGTRTEEIRASHSGVWRSRESGLWYSSFSCYSVRSSYPYHYPYWDWRALVYAVLSLTVIRMVPVALSLLGSGLDQEDRLVHRVVWPTRYRLRTVSAHGGYSTWNRRL